MLYRDDVLGYKGFADTETHGVVPRRCNGKYIFSFLVTCVECRILEPTSYFGSALVGVLVGKGAACALPLTFFR